MKKQIITIPFDELFARSEVYFLKMCGFDRDLERNKEQIQEAMAIRERHKEQLSVQCIAVSYPPSVICGDEIQVEDERISCKVLNRIPKEDILKVYFYGMCLEDITKDFADSKESWDLLDEFYLDTWMTAMLDGARDWIKDTWKMPEENIFLTEAFGPGFYGIGIDKVPAFLKIAGGEQIGMSWKNGTMIPAKSNVGMYLALSGKSSIPAGDCASCLSSGTTCEFCKNYISDRKKAK